jgi:hypothetical protein
MNNLNVLYADEHPVYRQTGVAFMKDHVEALAVASDREQLEKIAGEGLLDAVVISEKLYEQARLEVGTPQIILSDDPAKPVRSPHHVRLAKPIVQDRLLAQLDAIEKGDVVSPRTGLPADDGEIS